MWSVARSLSSALLAAISLIAVSYASAQQPGDTVTFIVEAGAPIRFVGLITFSQTSPVPNGTRVGNLISEGSALRTSRPTTSTPAR